MSAVKDESTMRLGYVVGTFPVVSTTFIARELEALRGLGHSVTVVSVRRPRASETVADAERPVVPITYLLPPAPWRFLRCHLAFASRRPRAYLGTLAWLLTRPHPDLRRRSRTVLHFGEGVLAAAAFEAVQVQLIHAHFVDRAATIALVAGRLLGVPYSVTAHANDIYRSPVLLPEKLDHAAFAVTVSDANRRHLLDACPDLVPDQLQVIHGWVDPAAWRPSTRLAPGQPPRPVSGGPTRIVSVGRLVEKKGHADLVRACAHLVAAGIDITCDIVGDGPLRAQLEAQVDALGLVGRVRLLGARTGAEVRALLEAADLFALACVVAADGDRDGMPVALAEAMAMGLPVVSTRLPGIEELVRPGTGLLVPEHDPPALADAIGSIAAAPAETRATMGEAGRAVVLESFVVAGGAERLAALFRSAIGRSSTPVADAVEGEPASPAPSEAGRQ